MLKLTNKKIGDKIDLISLNLDKFKSAEISISFFHPLERNSASGFALLASVLSDSCQKFNNFRRLNKYIEEAYGAQICYDVSKMGNYQVIEISISSLDNRFTIEHEDNFEKLVNLLCELIFNPLIVNNSFNSEVVSIKKKEISDIIDSQFSDKRLWSRIRCEQVMFENERIGIQKYGTKDEILALDEKILVDFYKQMLEKSYIKIMTFSSSCGDMLAQKFIDKFSMIKRKVNFEFYESDVIVPKKVKEVSEAIKVEQCKVVMGFRTPFVKPNDTTYAMSLASVIFGGAPTSRLFTSVREKMNLCYYCSSSFNSFTGTMFVESGIESSNFNKAKNEILNQIDLMCRGNITDDEINDGKSYLIQRLKSISDSIGSTKDWYLLQYPNCEIESPEDVINRIISVSKNDIIDCMNQISLDTIYSLKNDTI